MQVSDLSSYVLHESQFGYRLNVMLKQTLCVFVLIMTSIEMTVLFNLVFVATTNCMRQGIVFTYIFIELNFQGWRSCESTRLPPMWPGFDSRTRRHMWVEFVGCLLCTVRFSPGTPVFPLLKNQHLT